MHDPNDPLVSDAVEPGSSADAAGDGGAEADAETEAGRTEPHPDERQVRLDTDRSFVLYPVGEPSPARPPSTD